LDLALGIPLRNQDTLRQLLQELYDPSSPQYRAYLTAQEFAESFGPSADDYQAVIAFAKSNGLVVRGLHANRMLLDVSATVADIEKAFHTTLSVYQHPTEPRTFYAPDTEPSVEGAVLILDISGLDNFRLPRPLLHKIPNT